MKFMKLHGIMLFAILAGLPAFAQPAAPAADQVRGAITSVAVQAKQIAVTTEKGDPVTVSLTARTVLLRMPAGVTDPKQFVAIELPAVAAGDKLIALGKLSADKKTLEGAKVYILTKADIAQLHKLEDEDWVKRGTSGVVAAVDATAKTITIKVGARQTAIQLSGKTDIQHYSADSFKSTDAKPGLLADVKVDDQVRVLGNKSAEGDQVAAERIFFGTFRRISATIESIDPQANEIRVKDLDAKKPVVIRLDPESQLKKLAPEMAAMLARRVNPGASQGDGGGRGQGRGAPGGGPGGGRGFGGGRGGDIGQIFDRAPAIPLSSLKPGDPVVVLTTAGSTAGRVTAVMLVAGVEALLTSANTARDIMSGWNLGGGGGGGGEGN
jgi:uncharacterized membrane protein YgcG